MQKPRGDTAMNVFWVLAVVGISLFLSFKVGENHGYLAAESKMLRTNPPSQELEMACLGLWVGEQNKKYSRQ